MDNFIRLNQLCKWWSCCCCGMSPITNPRFRVPRGFVYFLGMKEKITTVNDWLVHGPFKCIHLTLRLLREVTHNLVYLFIYICLFIHLLPRMTIYYYLNYPFAMGWGSFLKVGQPASQSDHPSCHGLQAIKMKGAIIPELHCSL